MTAPTSPPDSPYNPVSRFLLGAAPPAVATIAALWQVLEPYMPPGHRGFLFITVLIAWIWPIAVWIAGKVDRTDRKFDDNDKAAEQREIQRHQKTVDRIERFQQEMFVLGETLEQNQNVILEKLEAMERSIKGLHRHLDQTDEALDEVTKEVAHLRKLVLGVDETPAQRLGPRSLP
ncbi:hypothetical protein [Glycomyces sp. NPDC048151]|uniref:hypothetical protein n=1 Tax=Glycomyces sp. NPDC048151 TaxID=3364002 RepID=UPI00371CB148